MIVTELTKVLTLGFPSVRSNMRTEPLARCRRRPIHDVSTHNDASSPIALFDA